MPLACEAEYLKRNPSKKLIVGVAIDGSTLSDNALQTACSLVQQERGDRLVILHVADSRCVQLSPAPHNNPKQRDTHCRHLEAAVAFYI